MQLNIGTFKKFLDNSILEDLGIAGDITSNSLIPADKNIEFLIKTRQPMIICGIQIINYFFLTYSNAKYEIVSCDADYIDSNSVIIKGVCNARTLLMIERTILNYLQHLSGVATLTNKYVSKIVGYKAKIYDTRKTIPGLRALQKYAVTCGGGNNHRLALDSAILIKDNHIAICGNIRNAIKKAQISAPHYTKIIVECDTLEQVEEATSLGVEIIMLDNMNLTQIADAIKIIGNKALIEVSGGVNLDNIENIAALGVDIISVGSLTHSAPAVDIGIDI